MIRAISCERRCDHLDATHDWPGYEGDFERTDSALTAGYLLENGWSVFGGINTVNQNFSRTTSRGYSLTFEAYGFFGGASKSIGLENGASISFSGALAFMTGDVYDSDTLNDSGNAVGLSVSVAYNLPLSDNFGMQLRGFYKNYGFSDFTTVVDAEESILGVDAAFHLNF